MSAIALALPLGLAGCVIDPFKGAPPAPNPAPPTKGLPPDWDHTTIGFFSQQIGNPATGWVTTVTVPPCSDINEVPSINGHVSNGSLSRVGPQTFQWTRAVSGNPAVAASGVFTADCVDAEGLHAHPVIAVTAAALP